jgi:hypothetical protein
VSVVDTASAQFGTVAPDDEAVRTELRSGASRYGDLLGEFLRAPQPNQSLPGAALRPSNRDMRAAPSMGGRSMRGGSGGRMNGSKGGRR